jgi:hypothetical protein
MKLFTEISPLNLAGTHNKPPAAVLTHFNPATAAQNEPINAVSAIDYALFKAFPVPHGNARPAVLSGKTARALKQPDTAVADCTDR